MEEREYVHYTANVASILAYMELELIIVFLMLLQIRCNSICSQINISDTK